MAKRAGVVAGALFALAIVAAVPAGGMQRGGQPVPVPTDPMGQMGQNPMGQGPMDASQGPMGGGASSASSPSGPGKTSSSRPSGMNVADMPNITQTQEQRMMMLNQQRHLQLVTDTGKLLALANELKADVDKSTKDTMSLDVIHKADEIEKLARSVKDKMKN